MQRSTSNELFIGLTISVILSLITNFALLMQRSRLVMDSEKSAPAYEIENWGLWFSLFWFFFFSFILFIICRWVYRWGSKIFRNKELKTLGLAAGVCILVACGLFRAYPVVHRAFMAQFITVHTFYYAKEHSVVLSQKVSYAIKNDSLPDKMKVGVVTVASDVNTYPLLIEHIFVLLFILLSMLLMHLFDKKQEMKLAYEKVKVEQLQNSYNALMEQINPHFFFNSLNGLNSLVRAGEQEKTLEFLEGLSKVFRYILQSKHKTLVTLDEELQFVKAYTPDGKKHPVDRTLDTLGEQLDKKNFFRANRQFIISRKAIKDIDLWMGNRLSVNLLLPVPERIIISKMKTPIFKKWIMQEEE